MFKKLLIFFILYQSFAFAQDIPQKPSPPRLVNDFVGGLLSQSQINQLEQKLQAYNDSTSTQIAVVIVKSVQPYDISEYAIKLGRDWGIGQKGKNNGIVLLWAPGDRKVFIATGYGAEGGLTDAYAKRIIEQEIKPRFKEVQYYEGLDAATDRIIKYLQGEFDAEPESEEGDGWVAILIFIIIIIIVIYFIRKGGGGRNNNRGGGGWIPYTTMTGWGTSSGGWSGGGGGGGGGFDFGGGSFGGGGAGGDY